MGRSLPAIAGVTYLLSRRALVIIEIEFDNSKLVIDTGWEHAECAM